MDWLLPGLRAMPNIHPLLVHFPIAFLLGALVLQALGVLSGREDWQRTARVLLYLGAIGAVAAATSGWFAEETVEHSEASHEVLELHQTLMLITTSLAVVLAVVAWFGKRINGRQLQVFLLVGLLMVALIMTLGADRGGQLVYQFATGVEKSAVIPPAETPAGEATPAVSPSEQQHTHQH